MPFPHVGESGHIDKFSPLNLEVDFEGADELAHGAGIC